MTVRRFTATIPPLVLQNLRTTNVTQTTIALAWDVYPGATGYEIRRNGTLVQTWYSGTQTTYSNSGHTAGTQYTYAVRPVVGGSGVASAQASIVVTTQAAGSIVLTGVGFGTKSAAAPWYFEDFESSAIGATDADLGWAGTGGLNGAARPSVQSDRAFSGTKAMRMIYPTGVNSSFPQSTIYLPAGTTKIRFACHVYYEWTIGSTQSSFIFKWARGGYGTPYSGVPRFYQTVRPNSLGNAAGGDIGYVTSSGTDWYDGGAGNFKRDTWLYVEYEYVLSDPGAANGLYVIRLNGAETASVKRNVITRTAAENGRTIQWLINVFDGNDSYGTGNEYRLFMDNAYIDTTLAHVTLTDSATFSSGTRFMDQVCSSWTDTQITIQSPRWTGFTSGATVYFHVWDDAGTYRGSHARTVP